MEVHFFFFSSRRRHTRLTCDWSSDVCSSDLNRGAAPGQHLGSAPHSPACARCWTASGAGQIGRASCRERVEISVVAGSLKKKKKEVGGKSEVERRTRSVG